MAYAAIHPDETSPTCAAFPLRAAEHFAAHGISRIVQVMTDNALAYRRGRAGQNALNTLYASALFTRHYRLGPTANRTLQPHPARRMDLRPRLHQ